MPLLAAVALAAPGAHVYLQQPALTYQVPLTQTVHYENRPVVAGYQTTVVKPALHSAPLALSGIQHYAYARQIPGLEPPADSPITPPPTNSTPIGDAPTPPPFGDAPTLPPLTPPTSAPPSENGTSGDQGGNNPQIPIPGSPILGGSVVQLVNPAQLSALAVPQAVAVQPSVVQANAIPVSCEDIQLNSNKSHNFLFSCHVIITVRKMHVFKCSSINFSQVATVRAAQAGDFGPLVTQEKVLAPGRVNTQITPQLTQIQPEITVRRIVHDVPVASPVAIQQTQFLPQFALQNGQIVLA